MVEIKNPKEIIISTSVPICPRCSAALRKIHCGSNVIYQCIDCKTSYLVVDTGKADNEVMCEELEYEKCSNTNIV